MELGLSQVKAENMAGKDASSATAGHGLSTADANANATTPASGDSTRVSWTTEEDNKLFELIKQHGEVDWAQCALDLGTHRSAKACQARYAQYLRGKPSRRAAAAAPTSTSTGDMYYPSASVAAGDRVECRFPPPGGKGWEAGTVTRVAPGGFWVRYDGESDEWNEKVDIKRSAWRFLGDGTRSSMVPVPEVKAVKEPEPIWIVRRHDKGGSIMLRCRADPSDDDDVWLENEACIDDGEIVEFVRREGKFALVRTKAGIEGFLKGIYVHMTTPASERPRSAPRSCAPSAEALSEVPEASPLPEEPAGNSDPCPIELPEASPLLEEASQHSGDGTAAVGGRSNDAEGGDDNAAATAVQMLDGIPIGRNPRSVAATAAVAAAILPPETASMGARSEPSPLVPRITQRIIEQTGVSGGLMYRVVADGGGTQWMQACDVDAAIVLVYQQAQNRTVSDPPLEQAAPKHAVSKQEKNSKQEKTKKKRIRAPKFGRVCARQDRSKKEKKKTKFANKCDPFT